ncbi:MAG: pentapeptide repeat-containing protein, partial [Halobacteria archaeon]|nr:pentapeptide repeat-containing protein [Halobacteria archaeon]
GGANVMVDDADFSGAKFHGGADFRNADFRYANFNETRFLNETKFNKVRFEGGLTFNEAYVSEGVQFKGAYFVGDIEFKPQPLESKCFLDLTKATIESGVISQPESGSAFYNLTQATVGDIELEKSKSRYQLFDYFLFRNTDFDGFDFSMHRGYLTKNDWKIHEISMSEEDFDLGFDFSLDTEDLETTYLKAKNSANAVGDNKAASEFFIREMKYRRRQYREMIFQSSGNPSPLEWLKAGEKWIANFTCGYGERPSKVIGMSVFFVVAFSIVFGALGIDLPSQGVIPIAVYSIQAYVSLIVGLPQGSTLLINLLTAIEGFIGAFFIALFVFALTRSVHR